jgi:hypothetical protein
MEDVSHVISLGRKTGKGGRLGRVAVLKVVRMGGGVQGCKSRIQLVVKDRVLGSHGWL